jgi:hypothetical protein
MQERTTILDTNVLPGWEAKILAFGSRTYDDYKQVQYKLREIADTYYYGEDIILINGGAVGADNLAAKAAKTFGWQVVTERANWGLYGKSAGPIRNQKMIEKYGVDMGVGFEDGTMQTGSGTLDMQNRLIRAGIMVVMFG